MRNPTESVLTADLTPVHRPAFVAFVPACKAHDMSKTTGYALVKRGMLNVIRIGRRTYIDPDEFRALPDRLAKEAA